MMLSPSNWEKPVIGDVNNMVRLMADWGRLFERYNVTLVLKGHEHAYSRSCAYRV